VNDNLAVISASFFRNKAVFTRFINNSIDVDSCLALAGKRSSSRAPL